MKRLQVVTDLRGSLAMARSPETPHQQVKGLTLWFDYHGPSPCACSQGGSQSVPDGQLSTAGRELGILEPLLGYISSFLRMPQEHQFLPIHPFPAPPLPPSPLFHPMASASTEWGWENAFHWREVDTY